MLGCSPRGQGEMKKYLIAGVVIGLLVTFAAPAVAKKFSFDLSKGSIFFNYATTGAYNPIQIRINGVGGFAQTLIDTDAYKSESFIEGLRGFVLSQIATVSGMELETETDGKFSSTTSANGTVFSVAYEGDGTVKLEFNTDDTAINTEEMEIRTAVYVDAESGRFTVEDSSPESAERISQRFGMDKGEVDRLIQEFGAGRLIHALENARSQYAPRRVSPTVAGGGGAVEGSPGGSVSFNDLSPRLVFQLFLWGTKYEGYFRNSTLYARFYHPATGESISDLRNEQHECYYYPIASAGLSPGDYDLYIDVGRITSIKLPIIATKNEGILTRQ